VQIKLSKLPLGLHPSHILATYRTMSRPFILRERFVHRATTATGSPTLRSITFAVQSTSSGISPSSTATSGEESTTIGEYTRSSDIVSVSTVFVSTPASASATSIAAVSGSPSPNVLSNHSFTPSSGAIASIVIGILLGLALTILAFWKVFTRRRRHERNIPRHKADAEKVLLSDADASISPAGPDSDRLTRTDDSFHTMVIGKRMLNIANASKVEHADTAISLSGVSGSTVVSSPAGGSQIDGEVDFDERFQARLAQFLQQHMARPMGELRLDYPLIPVDFKQDVEILDDTK
jgi:hypothetical protein